MKKKEFIIISIFAIVSIGYRFTMPIETVESIVLQQEITIHVEGLVNETLTFDRTPTIEEVFKQLAIDNVYGFDEQYLLHATQVLYIPEMDSSSLTSLNSATKEELMEIPGVGPVTADAIISQRNIEKFQVIEDIMRVDGIGEKTYYKVRTLLCI